MNKAQRIEYLKELMGWTDDDDASDDGFNELPDDDPDDFYNCF